MSDKEVKIKKRGGAKGAIIAGCAVAVVAVCVAGFLLWRNANAEETDAMRNIVVNEDNVEEILADLSTEERTSAGYYEVQMNTTWNFADGAAASEDAYVKNAVTNTNDVYFDVTLADTEELIYSSPVIPLGSYLENITLDTDLDAGTYDCVVTYHLIDEDQNTLSTLRVSLTINVDE